MRFLAFIGALAIIAAIAAAVYLFGGFFNVAENVDNPAIVDWALASVRGASVAGHATDQPPANLDDPETVKAGAKIYSTIGCVNCHGGPPGRQLGQVVRRAEAGSGRPQGDGEGADSAPALLGDQERHQVHRHAELRPGRGVRSGHLVDRRVHQEAAGHLGRRIQSVDRVALSQRERRLTPADPRDGGSAARPPAASDSGAGPLAAPTSAPARRAAERSLPTCGRYRAASAGGSRRRRGSRK